MRTPKQPQARPIKLEVPQKRALAHIPGSDKFQIPILNLMKFLKDPLESARQMQRQYGNVFRNRTFGGWRVGLLGPEANEFVLLNNDNVFSSELGWQPLIGQTFPRGLMLLDFDQHKQHRKKMQPAFRAAAMAHHFQVINESFAHSIDQWSCEEEFLAHPAVKEVTLELAARAFIGIDLGPQAHMINTAFRDMIAATTGLIRAPIPGSKMWRGVRGRQKIAQFFSTEIEQRRHSDSNDLLSNLCQASGGKAGGFTDQEIIDHMNFFMVAAHDTVTSTLTAMIYYLGKFPEWQEKMRDEFLQHAHKSRPALEQADLANLTVTEMVFKETLRLHPPIPGIPRVAVKPFTFEGHFFPAGTQVGINPLFTHRMEEIWPNPDEFDPTHFTKEKIAQRHFGAWVPFGGGAHKCIGLRVAEMEAKAFFYHLLLRHRIVLRENYTGVFKSWPISKPVDDLPITLMPMESASS